MTEIKTSKENRSVAIGRMWGIKAFLCLRCSPLATLLLLLSFAAGMFCLNMFYGMAENEYRIHTRISTGGTLAEAYPRTAAAADVPDWRQLLIEKQMQVENVLYLSRLDESGYYLIGWSGDTEEADARWWPHVSGRFFSAEELASDREELIYLDEESYQALPADMTYQADGRSYRAIGCGWIAWMNLTGPVSEDSPQTILPLNSMAGYRTKPKVEVLPYQAYLMRGYAPELVFLQFNGFSRSELKDIRDELQAETPEAVLTLPRMNTDVKRNEEMARFLSLGAALSLLVWASMSACVSLWLEQNKRQHRILYLCGCSGKNICRTILSQMALLLIGGEVVALLWEMLLMPLLSSAAAAYSGHYPSLKFLIFSAAAVYVVTVLMNLKAIRLSTETY